MVRDLKRMRIAMGDGVKRPYESEREPLLKMGKKIVAARDLPAGHALGPEDIASKSPGDGVPPYELDKMIGRVTLRKIAKDEGITFNALNGAETWAGAAS